MELDLIQVEADGTSIETDETRIYPVGSRWIQNGNRLHNIELDLIQVEADGSSIESDETRMEPDETRMERDVSRWN